MKTRIVHTKIWIDPWFKKLSRSSSLIFLYLITNQYVGLTGIYELSDDQICFDTGTTTAELEKAKEELSGKINFHKGWIKIANVDKYQSFSGSKNEIAKEKEMKMIPPEVLDTLSIGYQYPMHSLSNHKSEISNKKSVSMEEQLNEQFCTELAEKYSVSLSTVVSKRNDLVLYCKANGKKYKDYQAALQNWLRKDLREK